MSINQTGNLITNGLGENRVICAEKTGQFLQRLQAYHTNKHTAIKSRQLPTIGTPREIRDMTRVLRLQGHPIMSGNYGYYYSTDQEDIDQCLKRLRTMALSTLAAYGALMETRDKLSDSQEVQSQ
jgi:hypothetical protein